MSLLLKQIATMDVKSEEFFLIYIAVNEKYWKFEDPNEEQKARLFLHLITDRGKSEDVSLLVKIYAQIFALKKHDAIHFELKTGDQTFYVKISTSPDADDRLRKMLQNRVIVKSEKE